MKNVILILGLIAFMSVSISTNAASQANLSEKATTVVVDDNTPDGTPCNCKDCDCKDCKCKEGEKCTCESCKKCCDKKTECCSKSGEKKSTCTDAKHAKKQECGKTAKKGCCSKSKPEKK